MTLTHVFPNLFNLLSFLSTKKKIIKIKIRVKVVQWGLSRPDQSSTTRPNRPTPTRTEGPIGRRWVSVFKNQHRQVEWRVCFSKTQATQTRPKPYKKSGQICKNKPDPMRSQPNLQDLNQIWLDLVGFSQIRPNFSNF